MEDSAKEIVLALLARIAQAKRAKSEAEMTIADSEWDLVKLLVGLKLEDCLRVDHARLNRLLMRL